MMIDVTRYRLTYDIHTLQYVITYTFLQVIVQNCKSLWKTITLSRLLPAAEDGLVPAVAESDILVCFDLGFLMGDNSKPLPNDRK